MTSLALAFVCVAQLAALLWLLRSQAGERSRLINIALAKDPQTFTVLQQAAAREPAPRPAAPRDPERTKAPRLPEGL